MIKDSKGITLVSLVITIALMLIISSITISVSMDRFEINDYNKMINDLKLLEDKVSNYYLKYNAIPVVRGEDNKPIIYSHTPISFNTNKNDNEFYYILDLSAMEGISLNYGELGFKNINSSDDVYIINEKSHQIYYVRGVELNNNIYHTATNNDKIGDNIPPTKPEIKIISGTVITDENQNRKYTTAVEIEIIPGKDNSSGIYETTSDINKDGELIDVETLKQDNGLYLISENGTYVITVTTKDNSENKNSSTTELTIVVEIPENIT